MVAQVIELEFVFLSTSLLVLTTCALQINHTGEVVYQDISVYGVVDKAVVLECGAALPDLYIWSFTKPGTDAIKAVLYDLGKGPRIQMLAKMVGPLTILPNTASISIEKLPLAAHGLFTCQAFYDIEDEPVVYYYYVHLTVQVPVSKPYLMMSEASPMEGSTIWMNCSVENGSEPIQYRWQHESPSEGISDLSQSNSSIIGVTSISRNYTGWYHCEISNAVNTETSDRLLLNVTFGPDEPQIDVTPYHITQHGYSALENESVSMHCQARSNPGSQYVWFYNNSQIYTRSQLTIDKILRTHTGNYTCLAQNSHLHTQSSKTLSLTVYYPPDGSPECSVEPALNHTALRLLCSWLGGFPSPSLNWTRDPIQAGQKQDNTGQQPHLSTSNVMMLSSESLNLNSSLFTCIASHPALQQPTKCSTHTHIPPAEPLCFTSVTSDKQYLMLSCSWDGGLPKALVWWEGPGNQSKDGQENSNILVLRYGNTYSGKPYTCYAKHPLLTAAKTCRITLVSVSKPHLLMSDASPKEGSTIWMHCNIENGTKPIHYVWQHQLYSGNITTFTQGSTSFINITDIVRNQTGWYRCVVGNAVNSESSEKLWLNVTFGPDVPQIDVAPSSVVQRGFTALENETVSLMCRVRSNPASQYVWFHNDSEVYSGPQLIITKILRVHTGDYTCVGQNSYLNTQSRKTITLTVYYPPDGSPLCSVEPALNHTSLRLLCFWPGGFPSPSLHWTGDLIPAGQQQANKEQQTNPLGLNILLPSGGLTPNSSLLTCHGSHPALKQQMKCSTLTYIPLAEPVCFANVTDDKQFLILSCSWGGGFPKALLWWKGPGGQGKDGEESSNYLIVHYNTFQFGKPYMCYAKHPLLVQPKTCGLTLVPVSKPSLLIKDTSPVEGSTVEMQCNVEIGTMPIQYVWQHEIQPGNITTFAQGSNSSLITMTNVNRSHSGRYRCAGSNFINTENSDWVFLDIIFGPDVPQINVMPDSIRDRGYSALETEPVSLSCQAQSNPASQYIWFYNNSQVYTGPQYTIAKILRMHTGDYTCLAQNSHLNTRSRKTVSLIVYYPPAGFPFCALEPAQNHTSLKLLCSWSGGFPSPTLRWTGDTVKEQEQEETELQTNLQTGATILLPSEGLIPNNSLFTCKGAHPARKQLAECNTRTYIPPAEPVCFAYVTNTQQYLMLSCSWDGGAPKALVWWEGPGGQSKGGQENSNILVLRYGTARSGKPYTCYAKHPLLMEAKSCRLTLEAPVLLTQRRVISVYEGSDVQLTCNLRANYLPTNEITWFNNQGVDVRDTSKYVLLQTSAWANLTVRNTDEMQDSGEYRCSTSNAVGGAEINVTLVVKKHPMPPNATLIRATYNSRQRNEVELEWQVDGVEENGGWTGFHLEHRWVSERPNKKRNTNISQVQMEERIGPQDWYRTVIQDPGIRSHTVRGLTPTVTYQFRITPINHRTIGHPSVARTPVELRDHVYPAVVGAAVGGMLFAAIPTVLLLVYIIRNRNSNPRLHAMLFGSQHSQSRENINFPEDEVVAGSDEDTIGSSSPGTTIAEPKASSSLTTSCPSHTGKHLPLQT